MWIDVMDIVTTLHKPFYIIVNTKTDVIYGQPFEVWIFNGLVFTMINDDETNSVKAALCDHFGTEHFWSDRFLLSHEW